MAMPTPDELIRSYGAQTPEQLATLLGFRVERITAAPLLPGVTVLSEYQPTHTIVLYAQSLRRLAEKTCEPLLRVEQWHIAHELYHGLAESRGVSPWRVRETEADCWADELLTLTPLEPVGEVDA